MCFFDIVIIDCGIMDFFMSVLIVDGKLVIIFGLFVCFDYCIDFWSVWVNK